MSLRITTKSSVLGKSKSRKLGVKCWSQILNCVAAVSRQEAKTNYYLREGHVNHRQRGVLEQTAVQPSNPEKEKKEERSMLLSTNSKKQKDCFFSIFLVLIYLES